MVVVKGIPSFPLLGWEVFIYLNVAPDTVRTIVFSFDEQVNNVSTVGRI